MTGDPAIDAEAFAAEIRQGGAALDARIRRIVRDEIEGELRTGAIAQQIRRRLGRKVEDLIIEGQARLKAETSMAAFTQAQRTEIGRIVAEAISADRAERTAIVAKHLRLDLSELPDGPYEAWATLAALKVQLDARRRSSAVMAELDDVRLDAAQASLDDAIAIVQRARPDRTGPADA